MCLHFSAATGSPFPQQPGSLRNFSGVSSRPNEAFQWPKIRCGSDFPILRFCCLREVSLAQDPFPRTVRRAGTTNWWSYQMTRVANRDNSERNARDMRREPRPALI